MCIVPEEQVVSCLGGGVDLGGETLYELPPGMATTREAEARRARMVVWKSILMIVVEQWTTLSE
jgi:hypothetical protein